MMTKKSQFRVLLCGNSDDNYPRDRTLANALRKIPGIQLYDLRNTKKPCVSNGRIVTFIDRFWSRLKRERIKRLAQSGRVDIVLICKNNHSLLGWLRKVLDQKGTTKLIYDLWVARFLGAKRDGANVSKARSLDSNALMDADYGIVLTKDYADFFQSEYQCDPSKLLEVPQAISGEWLGDVDWKRSGSGRFVVAYWGGFLKQHGVDVLVEAARLLAHRSDIEFRLYGAVHDESSKCLLSKLSSNMTYYGVLPNTKSLVEAVDQCDVGVGHLKAIHDAHLVFPNKMMEGMARGKGMISVEAPPFAVARDDGKSMQSFAYFFDGRAESLASLIVSLSSDPGGVKRRGEGGRKCIEQEHSSAILQLNLREIIHGGCL